MNCYSSTIRLFTVLALTAAASAQDEPQLLGPGAVAPDFVSLDAAGKEVRVSDFKDKIVVLDFWATWCGPCIASFPHVEAAAAAHKQDDVVVLAVCTSDTREKFEAWVAAHSAEVPNLLLTSDPHDRSSDTFEERASSKLYHVQGIPTKFVIGKDGKIALTIVGHDDGDVRLEAGLARAGVAIDAAVVAKGEAQVAAAAREDARRAAEAAANPRPFFYPGFGGVNAGAPLPDFQLAQADGSRLSLSALRGKPVVIGFGWADVLPRTTLESIWARYASYGVQVIGAVVMSTPDEFKGWIGKNEGRYHFTVGADPAGKFMPSSEPPSMEERAQHQATTVIGQFFKGNMTPAMPTFLVADADGFLIGSFSNYRWEDAVGNLLLRAEVELRPEDRPSVIAPPEAFVPPAPRAPEEPVKLIELGVAAPDFLMQGVDGKDLTLAQLRGKVVVLDFWATWCGPCKAAMPHVQKVAETYADQGVVVIASCTSDGRADFVRWVQANQETYPNVRFAHDAKERTPERASRALYGVSGIPHQFVIDREGKLVASVSGYMEGEVLLDAALAQAGVKVAPDVLAQAARDQQKRDERAKADVKPVPMAPLKLR
ncbi:MAG: TlpA disulfide reductase family protein [Planctomycetota bacterium]